MYKVFIDHKPILFGTITDLPESSDRIVLSDMTDFFSQIPELLKNVDLDHPLLVVCQDKTEFEELFSGHKFIEAAGGVVKGAEGYLAIKRHGLWDLPKGKLEKGEEIPTAAIREVEEECGISNPEIQDFLVTTYHTYSHKGKDVLKASHWYFMTYKGNEALIPQEEEGITAVEWKNAKDLMAIRGNTFGSINEVLDVLEERLKTDFR